MKVPSHPFKIEEIGENTILTLFVRMVFLKYHKFWCEVLEKNEGGYLSLLIFLKESETLVVVVGENKSRTKRSATNKTEENKSLIHFIKMSFLKFCCSCLGFARQ